MVGNRYKNDGPRGQLRDASCGGPDRAEGRVSKAMARRNFVPVHNRGRVLADVAVMLADGGEAIAGIDVLRYPRVLGPVASPPTVWRARGGDPGEV